jgi:hypothetical protein
MFLQLDVKQFIEKFRVRKPLLNTKECHLSLRVSYVKNSHGFKHSVDKLPEF